MQRPTQSKLVRGNLKELFLEEKKPIVKLRVLSLNPRAVSWVEDAKNCARVYSRMLQARAICPRLLPSLSAWACRLLEYAPDYGFGDPNLALVMRRPTMFQSNEWLRRLLIEISEMDQAEKIYGRMVTDFRASVVERGNVVGVTDPICCITHRPMKSFDEGCWWTTTLDNGKEISSGATGLRVFKWLEQMIKQGLKRHRPDLYRAGLSKRIRARNKRNG